MGVNSKAIIRIWKYGILWFAMASYLVKSLITRKADQLTNECVALGKNIGKLSISSLCWLMLATFHKILHKELTFEKNILICNCEWKGLESVHKLGSMWSWKALTLDSI